MNTTMQFWALFKMQTKINPAMWFMPLIFGMPLFVPLITGTIHMKSYHSDFTILLMNQNLFFVAIFGAMIVAPERFMYGATSLVSSYSGTEFLLTRAIDRPVLYRAKAAVLFTLVLSLPLIGILYSLKDPDLVVSEYSTTVQQQCLANVPGSAILPPDKDHRTPNLISISRGNVLVAQWQFWVMLVTALLLQFAILALYPFKYAKWIFWILFMSLAFSPLIGLMTSNGKGHVYDNVQLFFDFAGHQVLFWCVTAVLFVLGQLWCERRFARMEF
jgi:hypothetical protein